MFPLHDDVFCLENLARFNSNFFRTKSRYNFYTLTKTEGTEYITCRSNITNISVDDELSHNIKMHS